MPGMCGVQKSGMIRAGREGEDSPNGSVLVRATEGTITLHPGLSAEPDALLLASKNETMLGRRVMLRDVKRLCKRLGFTPPARELHAFRHTFAINYIRRGGSVFHLQKCLGHSTLEMTRRYANLMTEDL